MKLLILLCIASIVGLFGTFSYILWKTDREEFDLTLNLIWSIIVLLGMVLVWLLMLI